MDRQLIQVYDRLKQNGKIKSDVTYSDFQTYANQEGNLEKIHGKLTESKLLRDDVDFEKFNTWVRQENLPLDPTATVDTESDEANEAYMDLKSSTPLTLADRLEAGQTWMGNTPPARFLGSALNAINAQGDEKKEEQLKLYEKKRENVNRILTETDVIEPLTYSGVRNQVGAKEDDEDVIQQRTQTKMLDHVALFQGREKALREKLSSPDAVEIADVLKNSPMMNLEIGEADEEGNTPVFYTNQKGEQKEAIVTADEALALGRLEQNTLAKRIQIMENRSSVQVVEPFKEALRTAIVTAKNKGRDPREAVLQVAQEYGLESEYLKELQESQNKGSNTTSDIVRTIAGGAVGGPPGMLGGLSNLVGSEYGVVKSGFRGLGNSIVKSFQALARGGEEAWEDIVGEEGSTVGANTLSSLKKFQLEELDDFIYEEIYTKPSSKYQTAYENRVEFDGQGVVIDEEGNPIGVRRPDGTLSAEHSKEELEAMRAVEKMSKEEREKRIERKFRVLGVAGEITQVAIDMIPMIAGGALAGPPGLVGGVMLVSAGDYYDQAFAETGDPVKSLAFALTTSAGIGVVESKIGKIELKLGRALLSSERQALTRAAERASSKALAESTEKVLTGPQYFKTFLKEARKEVPMEIIEELSNIPVEAANAMVYGLETPETSTNELLSTITIAGFLPLPMVGATQKLSARNNFKKHMLTAGSNYEEFQELSKEYIKAAKTDEQRKQREELVRQKENALRGIQDTHNRLEDENVPSGRKKEKILNIAGDIALLKAERETKKHEKTKAKIDEQIRKKEKELDEAFDEKDSKRTELELDDNSRKSRDAVDTALNTDSFTEDELGDLTEDEAQRYRQGLTPQDETVSKLAYKVANRSPLSAYEHSIIKRYPELIRERINKGYEDGEIVDETIEDKEFREFEKEGKLKKGTKNQLLAKLDKGETLSPREAEMVAQNESEFVEELAAQRQLRKERAEAARAEGERVFTLPAEDGVNEYKVNNKGEIRKLRKGKPNKNPVSPNSEEYSKLQQQRPAQTVEYNRENPTSEDLEKIDNAINENRDNIETGIISTDIGEFYIPDGRSEQERPIPTDEEIEAIEDDKKKVQAKAHQQLQSSVIQGRGDAGASRDENSNPTRLGALNNIRDYKREVTGDTKAELSATDLPLFLSKEQRKNIVDTYNERQRLLREKRNVQDFIRGKKFSSAIEGDVRTQAETQVSESVKKGKATIVTEGKRRVRLNEVEKDNKSEQEATERAERTAQAQKLVNNARKSRATVSTLENQIEKVKQALGNLNVAFELLDEAGMKKETGKKVTPRGYYRPPRFEGDTHKIFIHKGKATNNTVYHEAAHVALMESIGLRGERIKMLHRVVADVLNRPDATEYEKLLAEKLETFVSLYEENPKGEEDIYLRSHEFLAEFVSILSANKQRINRIEGLPERIMNALSKAFHKYLGFTPFAPTDNINDLIDFTNDLAEKLAEGGLVDVNDGRKLFDDMKEKSLEPTGTSMEQVPLENRPQFVALSQVPQDSREDSDEFAVFNDKAPTPPTSLVKIDPNIESQLDLQAVTQTVDLDIDVSEISTPLQELNDAGFDTYIVGGAVRDAMLGYKPKDIDIEVHGPSLDDLVDTLNKYGKAAKIVNEGDGSFTGIVSFMPENGSKYGEPYEFSVPRLEVSRGEGKGDFEIILGENIPKKEAFSRRENTLNAIGYNPITNELYNPFNGLADLKAKKLNIINERFKEDNTRPIRAMQFQARFGFDISEQMMSTIQEMVADGNLDSVPAEQWGKNFSKMMQKGRDFTKFFRFLEQTGMGPRYFPELMRLKGVPQDPIHHPEGDVMEHTQQVMQKAYEIAERDNIKGEDREVLMLSALLHDIAKPETTAKNDRGRWSAHGHEEAGVEPAVKFLNKLRTKNDVISRIAPVIHYHLRHIGVHAAPSIKAKRGAYRKLRRQMQEGRTNDGYRYKGRMQDLMWLMEADMLGRNNASSEAPESLFQMYWLRDNTETREEKKDYLGGKDLIDMGLKPGPEIGKILRKAKLLQEVEHFANREQAVEWAKERIDEGDIDRYPIPDIEVGGTYEQSIPEGYEPQDIGPRRNEISFQQAAVQDDIMDYEYLKDLEMNPILSGEYSFDGTEIAYKPLYVVRWRDGSNQVVNRQTFNRLEDAHQTAVEPGEFKDRVATHSHEIELQLREGTFARNLFAENGLIVKGSQVEAFTEVEPDLFYKEFEGVDTAVRKLLKTAQESLHESLSGPYQVGGNNYNVVVSRPGKYSYVRVYDGDIKLGSIKFRIADHSYNPNNNSIAENDGAFISVEIRNQDRTEGQYDNPHSVKFDSNDAYPTIVTTVRQEIAQRINEGMFTERERITYNQISNREVQHHIPLRYQPNYGPKRGGFQERRVPESSTGFSQLETTNDVNEADLVLPIGISGSGKSTWINGLPQGLFEVVSPDNIRRELTGDVSDQTRNGEVFRIAHQRIFDALRADRKVIMDATNVNNRLRKRFLRQVEAEFPNKKVMYKVISVDPEIAKQRIKADIEAGRDRSNVPEHVIDRQYNMYQKTIRAIYDEGGIGFSQQEFSDLDKGVKNEVIRSQNGEPIYKGVEVDITTPIVEGEAADDIAFKKGGGTTNHKGLETILPPSLAKNSAVLTRLENIFSGVAFEGHKKKEYKFGRKFPEQLKEVKSIRRLLSGISKTNKKAEKAKIREEASERILTVAEDYIEHVSGNLKAIYNSLNPDFTIRSKDWYVGANRIAQKMGQTYGYSVEQAAGVLAVLSPQTDWFTNISRAERAMQIVNDHADFPITEEMVEALADDVSETFMVDARTLIKEFGSGVTINDLTLGDVYIKRKGKSGTEIVHKATAVRLLDEVLNNKDVTTYSPEGQNLGRYDRKGSAVKVAWGSNVELAKALQIMEGVTPVSDSLGKGSKVRNFYNNIANPNDATKVTVDTHAAAAAHLAPTNAQEASHIDVFTADDPMYALIKEGYIRAANEIGILPRELQSITWEAVRTNFNDLDRNQESKDAVIEVWNKFNNGEITIYDARQEILKQRSTSPGWDPELRVQRDLDGFSQRDWKEADYTGVSELYIRRETLDSEQGGYTGLGDRRVGDDDSGRRKLTLNEVDIYFKPRINPITEEPFDGIELELIQTPTELRGKGLAREALNNFLKSVQNDSVYLIISPRDSKTSEEGLRDFYRSVGFYELNEFEMIKPSRRQIAFAQKEIEDGQARTGQDIEGTRRPDGQDNRGPDGEKGNVFRRRTGSGLPDGPLNTQVIAAYEPTEKVVKSIKEKFPKYQDIGPILEVTGNAEQYRQLIQEAADANKFGSSVEVKEVDGYKGIRLFVTENGGAGLGLTPDGDIVSVFSHPEKSTPNSVVPMLLHAINEGGVKADSFNTVLPAYYSYFGLTPASRLKFNEEFAPENWDTELYSKFQDGKPDVVFYEYTGGDPTTLHERMGTFGDINELMEVPVFEKENWEGAFKLREAKIAARTKMLKIPLTFSQEVEYQQPTVPVKRNNGNPMTQTPNGETSNLYKSLVEYYDGDETLATRAKEKVYSDAFFSWFGNWVNEPNNSSKVVDENGEPVLVHHFNSSEVDAFGRGLYQFGTEQAAQDALDDIGLTDPIPAVGFMNIRNMKETVDAAAIDSNEFLDNADLDRLEHVVRKFDEVSNLREERDLYDWSVKVPPSTILQPYKIQYPDTLYNDLLSSLYLNGDITKQQYDDNLDLDPRNPAIIDSIQAVRIQNLLEGDGFSYTNLVEDAGSKAFVGYNTNQFQGLDNLGAYTPNQTEGFSQISENDFEEGNELKVVSKTILGHTKRFFNEPITDNIETAIKVGGNWVSKNLFTKEGNKVRFLPAFTQPDNPFDSPETISSMVRRIMRNEEDIKLDQLHDILANVGVNVTKSDLQHIVDDIKQADEIGKKRLEDVEKLLEATEELSDRLKEAGYTTSQVNDSIAAYDILAQKWGEDNNRPSHEFYTDYLKNLQVVGPNLAKRLEIDAHGVKFGKDDSGKAILFIAQNPTTFNPVQQMLEIYKSFLTEQQVNDVLEWANENKWNERVNDKFFNGLALYMYAGKDVNDAVSQSMFRNFKDWFTDIINSITSDPNVRLTPAIESMYYSLMHHDNPPIDKAENIRRKSNSSARFETEEIKFNKATAEAVLDRIAEDTDIEFARSLFESRSADAGLESAIRKGYTSRTGALTISNQFLESYRDDPTDTKVSEAEMVGVAYAMLEAESSVEQLEAQLALAKNAGVETDLIENELAQLRSDMRIIGTAFNTMRSLKGRELGIGAARFGKIDEAARQNLEKVYTEGRNSGSLTDIFRGFKKIPLPKRIKDYIEKQTKENIDPLAEKISNLHSKVVSLRNKQQLHRARKALEDIKGFLGFMAQDEGKATDDANTKFLRKIRKIVKEVVEERVESGLRVNLLNSDQNQISVMEETLFEANKQGMTVTERDVLAALAAVTNPSTSVDATVKEKRRQVDMIKKQAKLMDRLEDLLEYARLKADIDNAKRAGRDTSTLEEEIKPLEEKVLSYKKTRTELNENDPNTEIGTIEGVINEIIRSASQTEIGAKEFDKLVEEFGQLQAIIGAYPTQGNAERVLAAIQHLAALKERMRLESSIENEKSRIEELEDEIDEIQSMTPEKRAKKASEKPKTISTTPYDDQLRELNLELYRQRNKYNATKAALKMYLRKERLKQTFSGKVEVALGDILFPATRALTLAFDFSVVTFQGALAMMKGLYYLPKSTSLFTSDPDKRAAYREAFNSKGAALKMMIQAAGKAFKPLITKYDSLDEARERMYEQYEDITRRTMEDPAFLKAHNDGIKFIDVRSPQKVEELQKGDMAYRVLRHVARLVTKDEAVAEKFGRGNVFTRGERFVQNFSEMSYAAFMNHVRLSEYKLMTENGKKHRDARTAIASHVNMTTGSGNFVKTTETILDVLRKPLIAPRLYASVFYTLSKMVSTTWEYPQYRLALAQGKIDQTDPLMEAKAEVLNSHLQIIGTQAAGLTMLAMISGMLADDDEGETFLGQMGKFFDVTSNDAFRIQAGNITITPYPLGTYFRHAGKSLAVGLGKLTGENYLDPYQAKRSWADIVIWDFVKYRGVPALSAASAVLWNEDWKGDPISDEKNFFNSINPFKQFAGFGPKAGYAFGNSFVPIPIQNVHETIKEGFGPVGVVAGALGGLAGLGYYVKNQFYDDNVKSHMDKVGYSLSLSKDKKAKWVGDDGTYTHENLRDELTNRLGLAIKEELKKGRRPSKSQIQRWERRLIKQIEAEMKPR